MFKKINRLVPGINFRNSFSCSSPQFVLKQKNNNLELNRFGIVVSKKIDKRAVARNRIKRQIREELLGLQSKMVQGNDILLIVRREIVKKTSKENARELEKMLKKLGMIK
jgi:ribonuclease P protein component